MSSCDIGRSSRLPRPPAAEETSALNIEGGNLSLTIRRDRRARRMILRLDRTGAGVVVTIPSRASRQQAVEFALAHSGWIRKRLAAARRVVFAPGAVIPLRGVPHEIRHGGGLRGTICVTPPARGQQGTIEVGGELAHLPRRLLDWLKAECKKELAAASRTYAAAMAVTFRSITLRDQTSRWGSCSAGGRLSYSWRLILAPPFVLYYVAAHEVAHLRHMNHSLQYWALVAAHCREMQRAKAWIRHHGQKLHSYGS